MLIAIVESKVLSEALKRKHDMFCLNVYLSDYKRTEKGYFVCQVVKDGDKPTLDIKLSLFDYTFNERESEKLWEIAKQVSGVETIDFNIIKSVEL